MKKFSEKTCKTVRISYGAVFSAYAVTVGALFIWQVLKIYISGKNAGLTSPFTREKAAEALSVLAVPFWLFVALTVAGVVVWKIFSNVREKPLKPDPRYTLYRLKKRMPASAEGELSASFLYVKKQQFIVNCLWIVCAVICAGLAIYGIVYLAIPSHFTSAANVSREMLNMTKNLLPCATAAFAVCIAAAVYEGISARAQLPHVIKLTKGAKAAAASQNAFQTILKNKYFLLGVRIAIGCIGVVFVIVGITNGSIKLLLDKAINICTECIGLG